MLAYSTLSQLGYMMAALGAGAYTAGIFHLFTHAFFKGLLFLGAGSVIHAVHSNNMSDMGGLRKYMPTTYWTFVIGSLALAGIFPLAGFFSKDEILASLGAEGYYAALVVGLAAAFVTAFYMARAVFLTFHGEYKGDGEPHESPKVMTYPLIGLATGAAVAGFLLVPGIIEGFHDWVTVRQFPIVEHVADSIDFVVAAIGLGLGLLGIAAGYRLFHKDAETQRARDAFTVPVLYPLLENKYYIDDLYHHGVVSPIRDKLAAFVNWTNGYILDFIVNGAGYVSRFLAKIVYAGFDQRGIDLTINALGAVTGETGGALRYTQSGKIQQYAAGVFAGAVAPCRRIHHFRIRRNERDGMVRQRLGAGPHGVPAHCGSGRRAGDPQSQRVRAQIDRAGVRRPLPGGLGDHRGAVRLRLVRAIPIRGRPRLDQCDQFPVPRWHRRHQPPAPGALDRHHAAVDRLLLGSLAGAAQPEDVPRPHPGARHRYGPGRSLRSI